MKLSESQLEKLIEHCIEDILSEVHPGAYMAAITKGRAAGAAAAERSEKQSSYKSSKGETFKQEIDRINRERDQKRDMVRRFQSAGAYFEKVFGSRARVSRMSAIISMDDNQQAYIKLEPRDNILSNSVFTVTISDKNIRRKPKEFEIGIGTKQNIARYIKNY